MLHKHLYIYTSVLAAFFTISLFTAYSSNSQEKATYGNSLDSLDTNRLPQIIRSTNLNKDFYFAGERIPTESPDVYERLDRELLVNSYWHSSTLLNLKAAKQYFPIIEPILAENGIPDDFKYLAVAESGLRNVSSSAGAKGIWQFMTATGEGYGLEINSEIDERYHVEKATKAACAYLKDYKKRFGDWTLVAAAYNMGGTRLSSELKKQRATSYYDLNVSDETMRYVFRIIAIKEIIEDPTKFGFQLDPTQEWQPLTNYAVVKVDSSIPNLGDFANTYGISYRELKRYNPWLRSYKLNNSRGKEYIIKIPNLN